MGILSPHCEPVHRVIPPSVKVTKYASGFHELNFKGCRVSKDRERKGGGTRSIINAFSDKAIRRCRKAFQATAEVWKIWFTLTYPIESKPFLDGRITKRHLNKFLVALRKDYPGVRYGWVLEYMKNGNPHYHVVVDRFIPKEWLNVVWNRTNESHKVSEEGGRKGLKAGIGGLKSIDRTPMVLMNYLSAYLSKADQKTIPENFKNTVGRWWGMSHGLMREYSCVTVIEYPDANAARSATRELRRARSKFLREKCGIVKWKWGGNGYYDSQTPEAVFDRLFEMMPGVVRIYREPGGVPW